MLVRKVIDSLEREAFVNEGDIIVRIIDLNSPLISYVNVYNAVEVFNTSRAPALKIERFSVGPQTIVEITTMLSSRIQLKLIERK